MTDELPPLWALNAAAKAVNYRGFDTWDGIGPHLDVTRLSTIAHARTLQQLAKYERPPVDEAELKRRQDAREAAAVANPGQAKAYKAGEFDFTLSVQPAYIALCHRDNVTPVPVEEWGK